MKAEYNMMRDLLDQAGYELGALFEHGLAEANCKPLDELSGKLSLYGLAGGAKGFDELSRALTRQKQSATPEMAEAVGQFSRLWRYIGACKKRLDHLELVSDLRPMPALEL